MRLEVSNRVDLALRAMAYLDQSEFRDGRSIAAEIGTSTHYLPQVLKPLIARGWLASTPGPGGGYRLAKSLGEITVLEAIHAIDGPTDTGRCALRGAPCPSQEECAIHSSWVRARSALLTELDATSLAAAMAASPTKGE